MPRTIRNNNATTNDLNEAMSDILQRTELVYIFDNCLQLILRYKFH